MIDKTIKNMKTEEAPDPSIVTEMLNITDREGYGLVTFMDNNIIQEGVITSDWCSSIVVSCYKGKGHALDRSN